MYEPFCDGGTNRYNLFANGVSAARCLCFRFLYFSHDTGDRTLHSGSIAGSFEYVLACTGFLVQYVSLGTAIFDQWFYGFGHFLYCDDPSQKVIKYPFY